MFHPDDEIVPGYRLEKFLGRGQFGEVWRATSPGGTQCALKILNLSGKQGWKEYRAIQLFKRIRHPHLAPVNALWLLDSEGQVLDDGVAAGLGNAPLAATSTLAPEADPTPEQQPATLVVATTLADRTLGDRLRECQQQGQAGIPVDELLQYTEEAAKGIDFLNTVRHDLGATHGSMQHCDIKPENILLIGNAALICDFGVSQALGGERAAATATSMVGSPAYMSPECAARKPSTASDQYSLALTYFELRTGELPFRDLDCLHILQAHRDGDLQLSALPAAERAVICRATSLKPADRFASATEMVRELRAAAQASTDRRPTRWRLAAAVLLALPLAVAGLWLVASSLRQPPGGSQLAEAAREESSTPDSSPFVQDRIPVDKPTRSAEAYAQRALAAVQRDELDAKALATAVADYRQALALAPDGPYDQAPAPLFVLRPPSRGEAAGARAALRCMAVSRDQRQLLTGGDDGRVWSWRLDDPSLPPRKLAEHAGPVWTLAAGRQVAVSADLQGGIAVSSLAEGPPAAAAALEELGGMIALAISGDDRWLAAGGDDGRVRLWALGGAAVASPSAELGRHAEAVSCLGFAADGKSLLTGSFDNTVRRWPLPPDSGQPMLVAQQTGDVNCLVDAGQRGDAAFAGEGAPAAGATVSPAVNGLVAQEHRVSLIQVDGEVRTFPLGHGDVIETLACDQRGEWLASGAVDGSIQVWALASGSPASAPHFLHGHAGPVRALAFTPGTGWLVSGGADKAAGLWRFQSPGGPLPLQGHEGRVLAAAVFGKWIITACEDGALRLWSLGHCQLVKQACDEQGIPVRGAARVPVLNARRPPSAPPPRSALAGNGRTGFRPWSRPNAGFGG